MPPPSAPFDLCSIGNACIDIVATADEKFLIRHGLIKSHSNKIDAAKASALYAELPHAKFIPGGVGANVAHVYCALGGSGIFHGISGSDRLADIFQQGMAEHQVATSIARPSDASLQTSQVFCLGSPDGDRTFASYDEAVKAYSSEHVDADLIRTSGITYLDSHMMLSSGTPEAFRHVISLSHAAGHLTCLNPCDAHTVIRAHPDVMRDLADRVTMLICNLTEAQALFGNYSLEVMGDMMASKYVAGAITSGANGAIVFSRGQTSFIPPADTSHLTSIDSNGAGDHFAGGFLYGFIKHLPLEQAGKLGQLCALDCLSHPGARPLGSLQHLVSALTKI